MRGYPLLTSICDPGWSGIERIRKVDDALFFLISSYDKDALITRTRRTDDRIDRSRSVRVPKHMGPDSIPSGMDPFRTRSR
jgi:hypothetical protein